MPTTRHLTRPGVRLRYDVRGSGPLLVLTGAPMAGMHFVPLADALADGYTVVTHDPRGISGSVLDDPGQDSTPELRADDLAAILDDLGAENADVFGSSGGAVTGLALVARHPRRVRTLVAHEPPVQELLPDAAAHRAAVDDVVETFHRDGLEAAFGRFVTPPLPEESGFSPRLRGRRRPSPDRCPKARKQSYPEVATISEVLSLHARALTALPLPIPPSPQGDGPLGRI
ncbi:alpha/beta fold hydrolase [Nonomuraea maritima]|uniref:alpha/beta fold hydrolase n=1 Tax=Nonomuraea maritima TaxID=683260 RepID=UPI00372230BE